MFHRVVILLVLASNLPAADPLRITVDPRLELLSAIDVFSSNPQQITRLESAYKTEMRSWFAPWSGHAAVQRFRQVWNNIDGPPSTILCVTAPPDLKPVMDLAECRSLTGDRAAEVTEWLQLAREFAVKSNFLEFYRSHHAFYEQTVSAFRKLVSADYITPLESYYGRKQHSYQYILVPLLAGNIGSRVAAGGSTFDLYNMMGPISVQDGIPVYESVEYTRSLAWHEFGHSFSNPVVLRHADLWQPYATLFEPLREAVRNLAYRQWSACVIEHVNRAHEARIIRRELGPIAAEEKLRKEEAKGFRYIRALYVRLQEYEDHRDRYPTIDDFGTRLLAVFREVAESRANPR
jgi:Domain of unknown function (DUF4932)